MGWFDRPSKLRSALRSGDGHDGKLSKALDALENYQLSSLDDGLAVCEALEKQSFTEERRRNNHEATRDLLSLINLFQQVANRECDAITELRGRGCAELIRLARELNAPPIEYDAELALFVALKVLAMYGTEAGADLVIEFAKSGLISDGFMWEVVLRYFSAEHPYLEHMLRELSDPIPNGFLAVALLDAANRAKIDGADVRHPFDSPDGKVRLMNWLTSTDPDDFSYAHSATATLPFISSPEREQFLALAMDHADTGVQMEAAWASAKLGSEGGVKSLARMCLDMKTASTAARYLAELNREDAIPPEADSADFQAAAEMCQWLAHPQEFGSSPDELTLYDTRELYWPPTDDRRTVWLFKYRFLKHNEDGSDVVGLGMVGSVTFALFGEVTVDLSPEDAYGLHCFWELECGKDPRAKGKRSPKAGRAILESYN